MVVLGSLAVRAGDLFLPIAREVVAREATVRNRECRIVASGLGEQIGDVAALCAAIYNGRLGAWGGCPGLAAAGRSETGAFHRCEVPLERERG